MSGWLFGSAMRTEMVTPERSLRGHDAYLYPLASTHAVLGTPLEGPWPDGHETIGLALGCFWGAEKEMWQLDGVFSTQAGYQGGYSTFPTYEETCSGRTGHTETVRVVYDPTVLPTTELLRVFWTLHDPTQGFRQGNDVGTQYRSAIFTTTPEQQAVALATRDRYAPELTRAGFGAITTEIREAGPAMADVPFYLAEEPHQQYLHKVPNGYCPVHSTGVACPAP